MANEIESMGLVDFLSDALNSTILADAESVESLKNTIVDYGDENLDFLLSDESGKKHEISIPKLAVAPLPLLRIQEAQFEVSGSMQIQEDKSTIRRVDRARLSKTLRIYHDPQNSSLKSTTTTTLGVKINVKMAQSDMPAGLSNLLQLAANSIQVKQ